MSYLSRMQAEESKYLFEQYDKTLRQIEDLGHSDKALKLVNQTIQQLSAKIQKSQAHVDRLAQSLGTGGGKRKRAIRSSRRQQHDVHAAGLAALKAFRGYVQSLEPEIRNERRLQANFTAAKVHQMFTGSDTRVVMLRVGSVGSFMDRPVQVLKPEALMFQGWMK